MNVAQLLIRAGQIEPERAAVLSGGRTILTYRDLTQRALGLAAGLGAKFDLLPGDRVAVVMKNDAAYLEALFACWWAGLIAVPVNSKLHAREISYILDDCEAKVILGTADMNSVLNEAVTSSQIKPELVEVGSADWNRLCEIDRTEISTVKPSDTAWLFYTSGTTGKPKGAMLSHRNLLAMTMAYLSDVDVVTPLDCILHAAPMSHGSGLYILPHVAAMAAHIIPESNNFNPDEIFKLLQDHSGVSFFAAPTMIHRLVASSMAGDADTSGLKNIIYGGAPMYLEDCKRALEVFGPKLTQIYGQGESPMTITVLPKRLHAATDHPRYEERLMSVGYAQCAVQVKTGGENDSPSKPGEMGEVLVRGETVMTGYWNRPEATAETLRSGWLHTGDVGVFDEDGFLTLKDRSKDVIISGGSNIYPREVEEVLLLHEAVEEVSVVGVPHADWGEETVAFVVVHPNQKVSPEALDSLCLSHIARFKRPKSYRFVTALPKNAYGKVLKTELRQQAENDG